MAFNIETVHRISPESRAEAAAVLTAAFAEDEAFSAFFPTVDDGHEDRIRALFSWTCRFHQAIRMPFLTAVQDDRLVGVATLQVPHRWHRNVLPIRLWHRMCHVLVSRRIGPASRLMRKFSRTAAQLRPAHPFHYVSNIGVLPSLKGEGIGSRLLDSAYELACAHSKSTGLVLDTISARFARSLEPKGWRVAGPEACSPLSAFSCFRRRDER